MRTMTTEDLVSRLEDVRRTARSYVARCQGHPDKSPSLSVREGESGILVRCWAGCTLIEITAEIGVRVGDLFFHATSTRGHGPAPKPLRNDRVALAFQFELEALDRRLRVESVNQAVNKISINELSDNDLDRLVDAVGRTYANIERAELFETMADDLRLKDFAQR
jgi:hypothetical protein